MEIDYTTPRTALHDLKGEFLNTRFGRPFAKYSDKKAARAVRTSTREGLMPAGIQSIIDGVENFNIIK